MSNEKHEPDWEWSFCLECKLTYTSAIKTGNELKKTNKRWPIDCQKSRSPVYLDCLYITCRLSMLEDIFSTAHAQAAALKISLKARFPLHRKSEICPVAGEVDKFQLLQRQGNVSPTANTGIWIYRNLHSAKTFFTQVATPGSATAENYLTIICRRNRIPCGVASVNLFRWLELSKMKKISFILCINGVRLSAKKHTLRPRVVLGHALVTRGSF